MLNKMIITLIVLFNTSPCFAQNAEIFFRTVNTSSPKLSPNGQIVIFQENNGPQRTHIANFGDGTPAGTEAAGPTPFSAHSTILGGVSDTGLIVGTNSRVSPFENFAYFRENSVVSFLPNFNDFSTFAVTEGTATDSSGNFLVGRVFAQNDGPLGKNYPALWDFDTTTSTYILRRLNGLTANTSWTIGEFSDISKNGMFATGFSGSTAVPSPSGRQAFFWIRNNSSFTALPFLPQASVNFSEGLAINDFGDIIVGRATNEVGENVPTIWIDTGTSFQGIELFLPDGFTSGTALSVSGDGFTIGGASEGSAVIWDIFLNPPQVIELRNAMTLLGFTENELNNCFFTKVTDLNETGTRVVGEALCGGEPRVFELASTVPVPEPGFVSGILLCLPFIFFVGKSK